MKFKQKSFRKYPDSLDKITGNFFLGLKLSDLKSSIKKISDQDSWNDGEAFLPNKIGRYSTINADGKEIVRRDLAKEIVTQAFYYTRYEFHGRNNRVEIEDMAWRSYSRYPRETLPAQNVHVNCIETDGEKNLVIAFNNNEDKDLLLHKLNLALEIFGSTLDCHIQAQDGLVQLPQTVSFVNWEILRSGSLSQQDLRNKIKQTISKKLSKTVRPVIEKRLDKITSYAHSEVVLGIGGYKGYVIYHFPQKSISVLESDRPNNATYIFDYKLWKSLSQMTKTEIINGGLAQQRLIHDRNWETAIDRILAP